MATNSVQMTELNGSRSSTSPVGGDYVELKEPEIELARKNVNTESRGLGQMLLKKVKSVADGVIGAVASATFGGSGQTTLTESKSAKREEKMIDRQPMTEKQPNKMQTQEEPDPLEAQHTTSKLTGQFAESQEAKCEFGEDFIDVQMSEINNKHSTGTITEHCDRKVPLPSDTDEHCDPVSPESNSDSMTACQLKQELREKEIQLTSLQNQIKEYQAVALEAAQVKDHSKTQSKAMLRVKQELDATKMSQDELVRYIGSLEYQVQEAETHSRKLETELCGAKQDYNVVESALRDTIEELTSELKSLRKTYSEIVSTKSSLDVQLLQANRDKEAFEQERDVLKKEIVELQDQLGIAKTEAELYKEDFLSERKDREKAHDLKEEMRLACDQKVHALTIQLETERLAHEESIQTLSKKLDQVDTEKDRLQHKHNVRGGKQHIKEQVQQKNKEIQELQDQLYEARQKAITAQEEMQAKTAQVKQYKKKDDQREEKMIDLQKRYEELTQEMERVRKELVRAKTKEGNMLQEERKASSKEMEKVRQELEKALKTIEQLSKTRKLTKPGAREELVKVQEDNKSLREDIETLRSSLREAQKEVADLQSMSNTSQSNQLSSPATPVTSPMTDKNVQNQLKPGIGTSETLKQSQGPSLSNDDQQPVIHTNQPSADLSPNPFPAQGVPHDINVRPESDTPILRIEPDNTLSQYPKVPYNKQPSTGPIPNPDVQYPPQSHINRPGSQSAPSSASFQQSKEAESPITSGIMQLVLQQSTMPRPSNLPSSMNGGDFPVTSQSGNYPSHENVRVQSFSQGGFHDSPQGYDNHYQDQPQRQPQHHLNQQFPPNSQWPSQQYQQGGQPPFQQQPYSQNSTPQYGQQQYLQDYQQNGQFDNQQQQYAQGNPGYDHQYQNVQRNAHEQLHYNSQFNPHPQQLVYWDNSSQRPPQWPASQLPPQGIDQHHNYPNYGQNNSAPTSPSYRPVAIHNYQSSAPIVPQDAQTILSNQPKYPPLNSDSGVNDLQPLPLERPVPKKRQQIPAQVPDTVSSSKEQQIDPKTERYEPNPNDTIFMIEKNALHDDINRDISEAAAEVSEVTRSEGEREGAPLDPNLICPMCLKQYRIGEIQLYRVHVSRCDGTKR